MDTKNAFKNGAKDGTGEDASEKHQKPQEKQRVSGDRTSALRKGLHLSPSDIEKRSAEIAAKTEMPHFAIRHGHLNQIENRKTVPGIFKLCSLAVCLGISIEEMLEMFGINVRLLKDHMGLKLAMDRVTNDKNEHQTQTLQQFVFKSGRTRLIPHRLQEQFLMPYLVSGSDGRRFTFGVVGNDNDYEMKEIGPGSIVQIDRFLGATESSKPRRKIYFLRQNERYICARGELFGRELTIIPDGLERDLLRLNIPKDAEIIGTVVSVVEFFGPL